jgi:hypothetical protein
MNLKNKLITMKKIIFFLIPVFVLTFLITSCDKDDSPAVVATTSPEGTWVGTGQYGTSGGNPTYAFSINFKTGGIVEITGNNSTGIDNATGTWALVADSVKATYRYAASSAIYRLSGKYSASSTVMAGTIGLDPATTGVGIFTVTKQP